MLPRKQVFLLVNILVLALVMGLLFIANAYQSGSLLFKPPATPLSPWSGLLTHSFQILCCIPPSICGFSYCVLKSWRMSKLNGDFLLASALMSGSFAFNEIYRIHIILLHFGISKPFTISIYAIGFFGYGLIFWRQIKQTYYPLLIFAITLLALAIGVDLFGIKNVEYVSLFEGIPKLLSGLNFVLYFWDVCLNELSYASEVRVKRKM